jgi:hypothetical protein
VHRTLIVPAVNANLARRLTEGIGAKAGSNMFITKLSATGSLPATHYISSGFIEEEFATLLAYGAAAIYQVAQSKPDLVDITLLAIQELMNAAIISGNDPYQTLQAMSLQLINEDTI